MIIELDELNFQIEVLDSTLPVLVDFWAEKCSPCANLVPVLDQLAGEAGGIDVKMTSDRPADEKSQSSRRAGIRGRSRRPALESARTVSQNAAETQISKKGFRIERSRKDGGWKLMKYYRSEAGMRKAYRRASQPESYSYSDPHASYPMVFPNGSILPRIHDPSQPANWEYRRLQRQP